MKKLDLNIPVKPVEPTIKLLSKMICIDSDNENSTIALIKLATHNLESENQELKSQVEKLTKQIEKMRKDTLITINCIRIDLVGDNWIVNKNKEFSISINSSQLISLRSDVDNFGTKFTVIHYRNESGTWINRTLEDIENLTKRFNGI